MEFMKIGVAFYSAGLHNASFTRGHLEGTKSENLKPILTPEKIDAFLEIAAADFTTFRHLCLEEEKEAPGVGKRIFNPPSADRWSYSPTDASASLSSGC